MSLTTDIWTDVLNTKSYLGLTAHYVEGNEYKSAIIGVHELDDRHTSENLQEWVDAVLQEWSI